MAMGKKNIKISNARNITWRGEDDCVSGKAVCSIYISKYDMQQCAPKLSCMNTLELRYVTDFTLKNLELQNEKDVLVTECYKGGNVSGIGNHTKSCNCHCKLFAHKVQNLKLINVSYAFSPNLYQSGNCILLEDPHGNYDIINSTIQLQFIKIFARNSKSFTTIPREFILTIHNSFFLFGQFTIDVGVQHINEYGYAVICITDCQFRALDSLRQQVSNLTNLRESESPFFAVRIHQDNVHVRIQGNEFQGNPSTELLLQIPVLMTRNTTSHMNVTLKKSNVTTLFRNNCLSRLKSLNVVFNTSSFHQCMNIANGSLDILYPNVNIRDSKLSVVRGFKAVLEVLQYCSHFNPMHLKDHPVILSIAHCTFWQTQNMYQAPVVLIRGFNWLRASLQGGNAIAALYKSDCVGLMIDRSDLQIFDHNEVRLQFSAHYDHLSTHMNFHMGTIEGVLISSSSHLLLANESELRITINFHNNMTISEGLHEGNDQYFSLLRITNEKEQAFNEFVKCYVLQLESANCQGTCFFQFINDDGTYTTRDQIEYWNASLDMQFYDPQTLNRSTAPTTLINGHFNNCQLSTDVGMANVTDTILNKTFSFSVKEYATVPYEICLCDHDPVTLKDSALWKCTQESKISVLYSQKVDIKVALLGDFKKVITSSTTIKVTIGNTQLTTISDGSECISVFSHNIDGNPEEIHTIKVETVPALFREYTLSHTVNVHILPCPPGMVHEASQCTCNMFLAKHFNCTVTNKANYRAKREHLWIGYENTTLNSTIAMVKYCPTFFCNDLLYDNGVTEDGLEDNTQCKNNRGGFMCSQCLDGKSAVLGSFECRECSHGWLALISAFVLSGIIVVIILFTFNLTVLQGTINCIVLYVNILGLMSDFMEEYANHGIRFPLDLISFHAGFPSCFYEGMDEFAKSLLMFAFPVYLIIIWLVIIIAAAKCNLKIFQVPFIANRSVPVLGTIMLLTYTGLASAVITSLRFIKIFEVTSNSSHNVSFSLRWFYQPELEYFSGKHLILAIIALIVCVFYLIPFTLFMILGDWLRRFIHKLWYSHFMDVLHGAYKWPLGFWFGVRLLVRLFIMLCSVLVYSTEYYTEESYAFTIAAIVTTLRLLQDIIQPFKSAEQHERYLPRHLVRQIPERCVRVINFIKKLQPSLLDRLFLDNTIILSMSMVLSFSSRKHEDILKIIVNIALLVAIAQILVIVAYHGYKFFPIPRKVAACFKSLKDKTVMCFHSCSDRWRQRNAEQSAQNARGPLIDIRTLVPPESDDESPSETESDSEDDNDTELMRLL